MRRFIAYILSCITMVLCVGAAFTPVFTSMKTGREYATTSGEQFVYELRSNIVEAGEDDTLTFADDTEINKVAKEMRSRLDAFSVEDYSVVVEGNNSVRVSVSIEDTNVLNYVRRYLAFNGGHFTLADKTGEQFIEQEDLLGDKKAYIVHEKDVFPYLVIPVNNTEKVRTLIDSLTGGDKEEERGHLFKALKDDGETSSPDLFLWNNVKEDDSLNYDDATKDPVFTHYHLTHSFSSSNFWYANSKEEKTEIGILFGQAKEGSENNEYDTSSLQAANKAATYYMNMINASSYSEEYKVVDLFVTESASGVTYNTVPTEPSVERLIVLGTDKNLALSLTLISTIVCTLVTSLILVLFYRLHAIGMVANVVSSVFLTFLLFILVMKATFNPAAVIGGILLTLSILVGEIFYANKFKEEVYKGRSLKKANTEASKKSVMIFIDIAVVTAFLGLMLYLLGGSALKPMGIVLFFGSVIALVMNLLTFRILNWLLTNTTSFQEKYNLFNIDKSKVPSIQNEVKVNYEGTYAEKNFTKHPTPFLIGALVLLVASIAGIITFGVVKQSPLNVTASSSDSTTLYVSIKRDNPVIQDTDSFKIKVMDEVVIDEKTPFKDNKNVTIDYETRVTYDYTSNTSQTYHYYVVSFKGTYEEDKLEEAVETAVTTAEGVSGTIDIVSVDSRVLKGTVGAPNQGFVALATGLAIIGSTIYFAFRYKPSKALAAFATSTTAATVIYGLLVLTRISTTPITSLVMPLVALFSLLSSLYYFSKEKELKDETKEELTKEKKQALMVKAVAISATPLFISTIIAAYVGVNFFGFGPMTFAVLFAGLVIGAILATLLNLTLLGPISRVLGNLFSKIKLPKFRKRKSRKEKIKLKSKNSSEPEETIFIGINDY